MNIFDNIKELEEIYLNLINEAKERHTSEFRSIKEKYDIKIENKINNLEEFIKTVLEDLSIELQGQINTYKENSMKLFKIIQDQYEKSKEDYINQLIKILELPF